MLSSFVLPDRRLITTDKKIYKLVIRNKGPISLTVDILDKEMEELIRAAIPQLFHKDKLKLQTEHLLAQCSLSVWQIPVTMEFKRQKQTLEKFPKVINITIKEKYIPEDQQRNINGIGAQMVNKHNKGRQVAHVKRTRSLGVIRTQCLQQNTSGNRPLESTSSSSPSAEKKPLNHVSVVPRNIFRPHCMRNLVRDNTWIAEEDIEEDIKMHHLSEPNSSRTLADLTTEVPERRPSFIGSVMGMLFMPLKAVVGRK